MAYIPYNFLTVLILEKSQDSSDAWISAISALSGALVGGFSTFLVCYYTSKKEREKEILLHKISMLEKASEELIIPLIDYRYKLISENAPDTIKELITHLRSKRNYFLYCPKNIRKALDELHTKLENNYTILDEEKIKKITSDIISIEEEFYDSFIEMKL